MGLVLCLMLPPVPAPAADLLRQVGDNYRRLFSFSMRIEHEDSSGLFPGHYKQRLRWRRGGRFELLVTSEGNERVPDYYADGRQVLVIRPGNIWTSEHLEPPPGTAPGWEVSTGTILGWLQNTPSSRLFLDPPRDMPVQWEFGPRTRWHDRAVREVRRAIAGGPAAPTFSLFLDARMPLLVGSEAFLNGKLGWELYTDQRRNPPLPLSLGDSPTSS